MTELCCSSSLGSNQRPALSLMSYDILAGRAVSPSRIVFFACRPRISPRRFRCRTRGSEICARRRKPPSRAAGPSWPRHRPRSALCGCASPASGGRSWNGSQMIGQDDVGAHLLDRGPHVRVQPAHHRRDRDHQSTPMTMPSMVSAERILFFTEGVHRHAQIFAGIAFRSLPWLESRIAAPQSDPAAPPAAPDKLRRRFPRSPKPASPASTAHSLIAEGIPISRSRPLATDNARQ